MSSNPTAATHMQVASPIESSPSSSLTDGWTVSPVWSTGNDSAASVAFAKGLQDILNRTETYPILGDVLLRLVVAVLVLIWSSMLWRKVRSGGWHNVTWRDALVSLIMSVCVHFRWMIAAIGLTGGWLAWSVVADGLGKSVTTGKLPSLEAFIAGLHPTRQLESQESKNSVTADTTMPVTPAAADSEAAALARLETALGLPEKRPDIDCVVCWSSEDFPFQLPCTHLVCKPCLHRLAAASRNLCPLCRRPLYSLHNTKIYLFQAVTASAGAQLALALVLTALQVAGRRYWTAAGTLFMNLAHAGLLLMNHWQITRQGMAGMEGYFASTSVRYMALNLAFSLVNVQAYAGRFDEVDWATFIDGVWQRRTNPDEWRLAREFCCWLVPGVAERVLRC